MTTWSAGAPSAAKARAAVPVDEGSALRRYSAARLLLQMTKATVQRARLRAATGVAPQNWIYSSPRLVLETGAVGEAAYKTLALQRRLQIASPCTSPIDPWLRRGRLTCLLQRPRSAAVATMVAASRAALTVMTAVVVDQIAWYGKEDAGAPQRLPVVKTIRSISIPRRQVGVVGGEIQTTTRVSS